MLIFYNIIQLFVLLFFGPFLLLFVLFHSKYRSRTPARFGFGLKKTLRALSLRDKSGPTFWIHALSVGETTSAEPLIRGLRSHFPDCTIIFSVTTKSGRGVADSILPQQVDAIIDGPLDILPVVLFFQRSIKPSMFILVETDFWPNNLLLLAKKFIPTLLVNGRVSNNSVRGYKRLPFFFGPMFQSLSSLCMQTEEDKQKMASLGIRREKIFTLGNLKFDTPEVRIQAKVEDLKKLLPENKKLFICGSTHPGEEEILIECYKKLRANFPDLFLVIAPRNVMRAKEIQAIAKSYQLSASLRTEIGTNDADMYILNTIGELSSCYGLATVSLVGGSFVAKGGHNPIEPAALGVPVIFGPHMEDFSEIAESLVECGGAQQVAKAEELVEGVTALLQNEKTLKSASKAAKEFVLSHRGVIDKHIDLIRNLI